MDCFSRACGGISSTNSKMERAVNISTDQSNNPFQQDQGDLFESHYNKSRESKT